MNDKAIERRQLLEIATYRNSGKSLTLLSSKYLYMPFSAKVHKQVFVNYCEVIIWPNGKIEYAIPSHTEKCINEYCKLKCITREQFYEMFKNEHNYLNIIMRELGIIFIWYDSIYNANNITDAQKDAISLLIENRCVNTSLLNDLIIYETN
jgi:hypothetical protein